MHVHGFELTDDTYLSELMEIASEYSPGGVQYEKKLREYKSRTGRTYKIGFETSPEFKRLQKSRRQKERRLEKRFALGRANLVARGDFSQMRSWNIVHSGPFWLVGRTKALEIWDQYESMDLDRYGVTIYQPGNVSNVYLTRYNFNKALTEMDRIANQIQREPPFDSDRPEYRVIEADDQFNVYVIQEMIP